MSQQFIYSYQQNPKDGFLKTEDEKLVSTFLASSGFDYRKDRVELYIYSLDDELLLEDLFYNRFKVIQEGSTSTDFVSTLEIDPIEDAKYYNFDEGNVRLSYNFVRKITEDGELFIENISPDRTELVLYSVNLPDAELATLGTALGKEFEDERFLPRIVLKPGEENYLQLINVGVQTTPGRDAIKVKLYEPLPASLGLKSNLALSRIVSEPVEYVVSREQLDTPPGKPVLRGPNFNLEVQDINSNPTPLVSKNDLIQTSSAALIYSKTGDPSVEINVDYSDYSSFIHFSSAQERLNNFQYKLSLIKEYEVSGSVSKLNETYQSFDHYDRFLYYGSGSYSWPKTNLIPDNPTGSNAIQFFASQSLEATYFDETNPHRLINTIPSFLREDPNNEPYNLFIDMIGQHFDNVWLYAKGMTDRYNADNRIDYGISKDLVADALRGFGIKLYGSNLNQESLFNMFSGSGIITGSEDINFAISASNSDISLDSYQKEIYKRIYHNTPLLLKSKGTDRGLRALLNIFGIPKNLIDIRYNGGQNSDLTPFYGPIYSVTSSLDKVRVDNTGSVFESTLSENTFVYQPDDKYTQDIHLLEVGFSPADNINRYLTFPTFTLTGYNFSTDTTDNTVDNVGTAISFNSSTVPGTSIVYINTVGGSDYTTDFEEWLSGSNLSITVVSGSTSTTFPVSEGEFVTGITPHYKLYVFGGDGIVFGNNAPVSAIISPYGTQTILTSSFDIDDYIGDPRLSSAPSYTALDSYAETTFSGSIFQRYNLYDYVRLLKYYDNTLFKMVKDFTPARTNVATGLIIKSHILERNKVKSVEVSFTQPEYSGFIEIGSIEGSPAVGKPEEYTPALTASFNEITRRDGLSIVKRKYDALYTGEFSAPASPLGSTFSPSSITTTTGELNRQNRFKKNRPITYSYKVTLLTEDPADLAMSISSVTHISP